MRACRPRVCPPAALLVCAPAAEPPQTCRRRELCCAQEAWQPGGLGGTEQFTRTQPWDDTDCWDDSRAPNAAFQTRREESRVKAVRGVAGKGCIVCTSCIVCIVCIVRTGREAYFFWAVVTGDERPGRSEHACVRRAPPTPFAVASASWGAPRTAAAAAFVHSDNAALRCVSGPSAGARAAANAVVACV